MSPSGGYWRMTIRYTVVISETTTRVLGTEHLHIPRMVKKPGPPASRDPPADTPKQTALQET